MTELAKRLNESFKANISFWNISRAFGVYINYLTSVFLIIGWIIGIAVVTPETAGLYGVSVLFLLQMSDILQYFLRQLISLESTIVSVERTFVICDLPHEGQLRTDYD